jgi:hypothetical protein
VHQVRSRYLNLPEHRASGELNIEADPDLDQISSALSNLMGSAGPR